MPAAPQPIRLVDLRQRALAFINESDTDSHYAASVVNGYLNDAYQEMIATNPNTAIEDIWTFKTQVGKREYPLPTGFLKMGRLFYDGHRVQPGSTRDMTFWTSTNGWVTLYDIWGGNLLLGPSPPSEAKTVTAYIFREPALMTDDDDEPEGVPNFLRPGLYYYAIAMLVSHEGDPTGTDTKMMARFKEYTKRYVEWRLYSGRDEYAVVRDVRDVNEDWFL